MSPLSFSFSTPVQLFKVQSLSSHNKSTGEDGEMTDLTSPHTKILLMQKLQSVKELIESDSEEEKKKGLDDY